MEIGQGALFPGFSFRLDGVNHVVEHGSAVSIGVTGNSEIESGKESLILREWETCQIYTANAMEALTVFVITETEEIIKVLHDATDLVAEVGFVACSISESSTNPFQGELLGIIKALLNGVENLEEEAKPVRAGKN